MGELSAERVGAGEVVQRVKVLEAKADGLSFITGGTHVEGES